MAWGDHSSERPDDDGFNLTAFFGSGEGSEPRRDQSGLAPPEREPVDLTPLAAGASHQRWLLRS